MTATASPGSYIAVTAPAGLTGQCLSTLGTPTQQYAGMAMGFCIPHQNTLCPPGYVQVTAVPKRKPNKVVIAEPYHAPSAVPTAAHSVMSTRNSGEVSDPLAEEKGLRSAIAKVEAVLHCRGLPLEQLLAELESQLIAASQKSKLLESRLRVQRTEKAAAAQREAFMAAQRAAAAAVAQKEADAKAAATRRFELVEAERRETEAADAAAAAVAAVAAVEKVAGASKHAGEPLGTQKKPLRAVVVARQVDRKDLQWYRPGNLSQFAHLPRVQRACAASDKSVLAQAACAKNAANVKPEHVDDTRPQKSPLLAPKALLPPTKCPQNGSAPQAGACISRRLKTTVHAAGWSKPSPPLLPEVLKFIPTEVHGSWLEKDEQDSSPASRSSTPLVQDALQEHSEHDERNKRDGRDERDEHDEHNEQSDLGQPTGDSDDDAATANAYEHEVVAADVEKESCAMKLPAQVATISRVLTRRAASTLAPISIEEHHGDEDDVRGAVAKALGAAKSQLDKMASQSDATGSRPCSPAVLSAIPGLMRLAAHSGSPLRKRILTPTSSPNSSPPASPQRRRWNGPGERASAPLRSRLRSEQRRLVERRPSKLARVERAYRWEQRSMRPPR